MSRCDLLHPHPHDLQDDEVKNSKLRTVLILTAAAGLLAGCGTVPHEEVGFYGNRHYSATEPAFWCDINTDRQLVCPAELDDKVATLDLHPGDGVVISVPAVVRDTSWLVIVYYLDRDGNQQEARSRVFEPGSTLTYTVPMGEGEQLTELQVQSITGTIDQDDKVVYQAWRSWVLAVNPVKRSPVVAE